MVTVAEPESSTCVLESSLTAMARVNQGVPIIAHLPLCIVRHFSAIHKPGEGGGAVSACCRHSTRIFENMQEEGVSISIGSGWKPVLMGSRRRAPSQGAGASWCRVVWAFCHPTLWDSRLPGCSLMPVLQERAGFWAERGGAQATGLVSAFTHSLGNPGLEGGWPPCATYHLLPSPCPLPLSGSSPDLTASFFLPLFSGPNLHRTTALLLMPFNTHTNPSVWYAKTREPLSHSGPFFFTPRETCLLRSSQNT